MATAPQLMSEQERAELIELGYSDPVFFCRTFLADWFPLEMPWVHRGMLAIILRRTDFLLKYGEIDKIISNFVYRSDPSDELSPLLPFFVQNADGSISLVKRKNALLELPRGFAKTTIINAAVLFLIVYRDRRFVVYLSETATHSSAQLLNVKRQLEHNDYIRLVFGNLVPDRNDSLKWTDDKIETTNGVCVIARGRGGQVRGSNVDAVRPDLIIGDDIEDEDSVQTEDQRQKVRNWFYGAVLPSQSELNPDASIILAGTLLHQDALLQYLKRDPEWATVVFGALDRQAAPLWPAMMDAEKLARKRASFVLAGKLDVFYREYFNEVRNEETALFHQSFFIYEPCTTFEALALAVDPAISESRRADYCAFAVAGITRRGQLYVLEAYGERGMKEDLKVDKIFEFYKRWSPLAPLRVGIEATAYQRALIYTLRTEMPARGVYFPVTEITHMTAKTDRIKGILRPRYAAGYIKHARRFPLLEQQLLDYPFDHDDLPDALAMAIELLDPHAAAYAPETVDLEADEYEPLEKVVGGEWRCTP